MAEPFGIAAGAIGIAAAFTAVVDCFDLIRIGQHMSRDARTDILALKGTQLRFIRWGKAVRINEDPLLGRPDATSDEIQNVHDTIFQILTLFSESQKISSKYVASKPNHDLKVLTSNDYDEETVKVFDWLRRLIRNTRAPGDKILNASIWALYHRDELRTLINDVTRLFDNVQGLFPASAAQREMANAEVTELEDEASLKLLLEASKDNDPVLKEAVEHKIEGHQYRNIKLHGPALLADEYSDTWEKGAVGKSHIYDGVEVGQTGKALVGNKYGGPGFFTSNNP